MQTSDFNTIELLDAWYEHDPAMRFRSSFPFNAATGTESSAVAYFEIEPDHFMGTHTHPIEEIVLILAGTVEVSQGDERATLSTGQVVRMPSTVPHRIRNIGQETAKGVGFFPAATVESTFDQPMMRSGSPADGAPTATGGRV